jgi:hypothetical protein
MIWIYNTQFYETRKIYSVEHCRVIESCSEFAEEDLIDLFENPRLFTLPFILSPSPSIIGGQPTPSESTIVWKGWNKLFRYMKRDKRTRREGGTSHRISIWVWTRDVKTHSWPEKWTKGEGMDVERFTRGFSDLISEGGIVWCSAGVQTVVSIKLNFAFVSANYFSF